MRFKSGYKWFKESEHWFKRRGTLHGSGCRLRRYYLLHAVRRNKRLAADEKDEG